MAPPAGHIRPGRYLGTFAVIVVALYALVFGTGDHQPSPKLGIDLKGGTTVTLTARTLDGKPPPQQDLNQAQQIIQSRVNGLGVSGAQVVINGSNLVITVPGDQGQEAKTLGQTARLYLRPLLAPEASAAPAPAAPTTTPSKTTTPTQTTAPTAKPASPTTSPTKAQGLGAPGQNGGVVLDAYAGAAPTSNPPTTPSGAPTTTPGDMAGMPGMGDTSTAPTGAVPIPPAWTGASSPCYGVDPQVQATQAPLTAAEQAALITECRVLRQTTDTTAQQTALGYLHCGNAPSGRPYSDPLLGNDDPTKPLVACSQDGKTKYILDKSIISGTDISDANSGPDPNGAGYVVNLTFNGHGSGIWASYTGAHNTGGSTNSSSAPPADYVAFVLDGQVVSASVIQSTITGSTQISGNFDQTGAQNLANVLKYGSLPLAFTVSNANSISATLGLSSLQSGLIAGGLGLILVVLYCLAYYRALGVLTVLSLVLSGITVYAVLVLLGRWIGYSLDLAGIAGFIIAIGITADSFVIFFERLKDEVREGRTFRSAVPRAWVRARRTILASDAVSFLAAVVLYVIAVSDVQGFAFTLGMSTLLDLLIVFLVTHPLVVLASRSKTLSKPSMSGLGAVQRAGAALRAAKNPAPAAAKEA
ncbi:MAG TPA: protein translocase subunit SecD [Pseudonocardiaceae bacterium]|nr:protein translocase subunit SecD [Pseudonocardiaceae bacterium]